MEKNLNNSCESDVSLKRVDFFANIKLLHYTLGIGVVLIFILPYLFTRPALFNWSDFTNTGGIGDTIGGITAPFVGIIGAILVYMSFLAQNRANKIQFKALNDEIELNLINNNYNMIQSLISNLKDEFERPIFKAFHLDEGYTSVKNIFTIYASLYKRKKISFEHLLYNENTNLQSITNNFIYLNAIIDLADNNKVTNDQRIIFATQLHLFLNTYITEEIHNFLSEMGKSELIEIKLYSQSIIKALVALDKFSKKSTMSFKTI